MGQTIDKVAVVRVYGEKGASWKAVENDGKRTIRTRNVGIFCQERARAQRFREEAGKERASRNTGSVAAGMALFSL